MGRECHAARGAVLEDTSIRGRLGPWRAVRLGRRAASNWLSGGFPAVLSRGAPPTMHRRLAVGPRQQLPSRAGTAAVLPAESRPPPPSEKSPRTRPPPVRRRIFRFAPLVPF